MKRTLLMVWALIALTGCTLSFSGTDETVLPEFSGLPLVRVTAPLPNTTYLSGVSVNVQVQVANAGTDIDRVEVFVDDVLIGTLPQPNPTSASAFGVTQTFNTDDAGVRNIRAVAYRKDGTASAPANVAINVIAELPQSADVTIQPTNTETLAAVATEIIRPVATTAIVPTISDVVPTSQSIALPTGNPTAANTPVIAATPVTSSAAPVAHFEGVVNVRSGPHTNFEPPLGTFQAGQQAKILSVYTDGSWLKVEFSGGTGWVFASIARIEGDISGLPREAGPAIPTARPVQSSPVPPVTSAAPATAAPSVDGPNLVILNWEMSVIDAGRPANDIVSGKPSIAFVRVKNTGNQPIPTGFFAVLTIVNASDGGAKLLEAVAVTSLDPGVETVLQIGFTDTTAAGTARAAVVRLDEDNRITETNESDNESSPINYTLAAP